MTELALIPEAQRDTARLAFAAAFGRTPFSITAPVTGGASGALVYRVEAQGRPYLLRLETARDFFRDPARTFACMASAAEAGLAPAVRYADPARGVAIMDYVEARPLSEHPGGPAGIARAMGALAARLHALPAFPPLADYPAVIGVMLSRLVNSAIFAPGLLTPHVEGFEAIRRAYRWEANAGVASHNDPNPRNILYDGERLWLIDWELAYRNDPLTDLAILVDNFGRTPELEDVLLQSALGRAPDAHLRARMMLMRQMTRLFYACAILGMTAAATREAPEADLSAPTPEAFTARVTSGELTPGEPATTFLFGKMLLAAYRDTLGAGCFKEALTVAGDGA